MALARTIAARSILIVVLCASAQHVAAQPRYSVTDLGVLSAFDASQAGGVNASGQVAGWSTSTAARIDHAFLWTGGSGMQDLGTLVFDSSSALAINAFGQATGEVYNSAGPSHAFLWTNTTGLSDIHV